MLGGKDVGLIDLGVMGQNLALNFHNHANIKNKQKSCAQFTNREPLGEAGGCRSGLNNRSLRKGFI